MTDTSPPAFPFTETDNAIMYPGMTLRDYFAGQVVGHIYKDFWDAVRADKGQFDADWPMGLAMEAYRMADAMLKAREHPIA